MDFSVNEERAKKIAAMRAQKERQLRNRELARKYFPFALGGVVVCAAAISISMNAHFRSTDNQQSASLQSNEIVADTYVINEQPYQIPLLDVNSSAVYKTKKSIK